MRTKLHTLALLTGALGLLSIAGCPQSQNTDGTDNTGGDGGSGDTSSQTITSGGVQRTFSLHIPKNYNASSKTAVVLLLHLRPAQRARFGQRDVCDPGGRACDDRHDPEFLAVHH